MKIEATRAFNKNYQDLALEIKIKTDDVIKTFLDCYANRSFPKSLRVHKCGPFISISVTMDYRIFVLPITEGIKFSFVGDHQMAEKYLKKH